jgi:hypothetical protein
MAGAQPFPYFLTVDRNVFGGLKTQPHAPTSNVEYGDLDGVSESACASNDNCLIVFP